VSSSISSAADKDALIAVPEALDELLAPLMVPAYRLAYGMLRDRQDAEDAVQEAALNAWSHRRTFRRGSDPKPWFFAIVANQCRRSGRRRWMRLLRRADAAAEPVQPQRDIDTNLDLRLAITRLGHEDRLVIVLRYYMDLPFEEIAATLGISDQAARSRTHRAVRRLRPEVLP